MNQLKLYIFGAVLIGITVLIGYLYISNVELSKTVATQVVTIDKLNISIDGYKETLLLKEAKIVSESKLRIELEKSKQTLNDTLQKTTKVLNLYKDRQDIVFKKPGLVQIKEQKALDKFFEETLK